MSTLLILTSLLNSIYSDENHVTKQKISKMATFLAVPLKQTQEAELIKPMRSFIQNTFSQADPDDYNKALNEFSKLRNLMIAKSVDKHDSALEILYR
jgi:programmed cell death 6-interacting protein